MNYAKEYYSKIKKGTIRAPKRIIKVYKSVLDSLGDKYYYDDKAAQRVVDFVEGFCRQSKAPFTAQLLKLQLFQKAKICLVYGVKRKSDGQRRFREVFDMRGRKNGKSTELAALGLYHLIADSEGGAEVYCVATKRDQARRVFDEAVNMVSQSKDLSENVRKRKTDLYFPATFSKFQPLASDSNTLDGLNASCAIIDELHAINDMHLYDVIKRSTATRKQPVIHIITTAGTVRNSIFDSKYDEAKAVADGMVKNDELLPLIYELDDRKEWADPKMWVKANPGLRTIKSLTYLKGEVEKAKKDKSQLRPLLCYEFDILDSGTSAWLSSEDVENPATFDIKEISHCYGIGGCDLSATTDLTCATMLVKKEGKLYCLQQYFLPRTKIDQLALTKSHEAPYEQWQAQGWVTICPGSTVDYHMVTEWFLKLYRDYEIIPYKVGYDRALAGYWAEEMASAFSEETMDKVAQGPFTWSGPMKALGGALQDKAINFNNNPVLKWCLYNTAAKSMGTLDNIQPVKISSSRRIDGMVSLLNAYTEFIKVQSDYENLQEG